MPEYVATEYDAAHKLALAEAAKHKAAMRGGAFKLPAPKHGGSFDSNPYKEPESEWKRIKEAVCGAVLSINALFL